MRKLYALVSDQTSGVDELVSKPDSDCGAWRSDGWITWGGIVGVANEGDRKSHFFRIAKTYQITSPGLLYRGQARKTLPPLPFKKCRFRLNVFLLWGKEIKTKQKVGLCKSTDCFTTLRIAIYKRHPAGDYSSHLPRRRPCGPPGRLRNCGLKEATALVGWGEQRAFLELTVTPTFSVAILDATSTFIDIFKLQPCLINCDHVWPLKVHRG